ncbi:MAG: sensor domain-containing diguanylate cyclase [Gemmobacter sp.]|nr:sensor domain-containing diguanylate cyclase [Gemmobacter sp.]
MNDQHEQERLSALHALDIIGAPREPALDRIVRLVRMEFGARHAGITMVDRKTVVFAARDNISNKSMPRGDSFCNIAIQNDEPLVLHDTLLDSRSMSHPQTMAGIRSYAAIPLRTRDGYNVGALCVYDTELLALSQSKIRNMKQLALLVMDCIELRRLAIQDHLTGAMNRRGFMTELDREMYYHDRRNAPLSLALMDLDHFKQINDRYGHLVGDQVLKSVVEVVDGKNEDSQIIGRLGGEEFGILMPGQDGAAAFQRIERLRGMIESIRLPAVPDLRITASFGIAEAGSHAKGTSSLIANADTGLYRAKSERRNMTVLVPRLQEGDFSRAH